MRKLTLKDCLFLAVIGALSILFFKDPVQIIGKASAETITINQDENLHFDTSYDGNDLVIDGGAEVKMDGEHSFNSVTIKNNSTLTQNTPKDISMVYDPDTTPQTLYYVYPEEEDKIPVTTENYTVRLRGFVVAPDYDRTFGSITMDFSTRFGMTCGGPCRAILRTTSGGAVSTIGSWTAGAGGTYRTPALNENQTYALEVWLHKDASNRDFELHWEEIDPYGQLRSYHPLIGYTFTIGYSLYGRYYLTTADAYLTANKTAGWCGTSYGTYGLCGEYFYPHSWDGRTPDNLGSPSLVRITRGDRHTKTLSMTDLGNTVLRRQSFRESWNTDNSPIRRTQSALKLNIAGDLRLESGGKIDLSTKGFRGGFGMTNNMSHGDIFYITRGRGSGGGDDSNIHYMSETDRDDVGGGGGGFGNNGGVGNCNAYYTTIGGPAYGNATDEQLETGSGGAGGMHQGNGSTAWHWLGGAGGGGLVLNAGGQVYISATSGITANGGNGVSRLSLDRATELREGCSGGGSGGLIYINAQAFQNDSAPVRLPNTSPVVDGGAAGLQGTLYNAETGTYDLNGYGRNITAMGGAPNGAGGRIVIDAPLGQRTATVNADPQTITEENGISVVTVSLDGVAFVSTPVTLDFTGNAPVADYRLEGDIDTATKTVTFGVGEQTKTFRIIGNHNVTVDGNRTVIVTIVPNVQIIVGDPAAQTVTITDDDGSGPPPPPPPPGEIGACRQYRLKALLEGGGQANHLETDSDGSCTKKYYMIENSVTGAVQRVSADQCE